MAGFVEERVTAISPEGERQMWKLIWLAAEVDEVEIRSPTPLLQSEGIMALNLVFRINLYSF